ncbi:MAG: undecaprenyldiphospho-muramoylpentapeptide beta-N-acetylglucosaminyltransferase [Spirochaetia bacterium]|nr:undecaprenyldiphospho-muramoylpentapeptide beta-N-acetylglucosaminyltransferase [Spirochaetia bacterium]
MDSTVLIVAGGTGGHIAPGIALAEELIKQEKKLVFLSLERNRQYPDLIRPSFPVEFYKAPSLSGIKNKLIFPFMLVSSMFRVRGIIKKFGITSMICMGGYSTVPAALYASLFRVSLFLCEQNAMPGKATVLFGRFADQIYLNFPDRSGKLKKFSEKSVIAGNPLRTSILNQAKRGKKETKNLSVLVLGGSQGAVQLNEMSAAAIPQTKGVNWTIQCGDNNIEAMQKTLAEHGIQDAELFGFHSDIHRFYRNADVLICRAGAGVLSEGCLFGLPMILIPYPYAADDHQKKNALYLEEKGAAFVISTKENNPDELINYLKRLQTNSKLRESMGKASLASSKKEASETIVKSILERIQA